MLHKIISKFLLLSQSSLTIFGLSEMRIRLLLPFVHTVLMRQISLLLLSPSLVYTTEERIVILWHVVLDSCLSLLFNQLLLFNENHM